MKLLISLMLFGIGAEAFAIDGIRCVSREASPYPDSAQVLTINLKQMTAIHQIRSPISEPIKLKAIKDYGKAILFRGADPVDVNRIQIYIPKYILNATAVGVSFETKVTEGMSGEYGWIYETYSYHCTTTHEGI